VAPDPIVRVRRWTETWIVRFGVVVEGHAARLTVATTMCGAGRAPRCVR
jgi:hypothetical protein